MNKKFLEEVWSSIKDFEGLYEISNFGNVKSIRRKGTKGIYLKQDKRKDGYFQVHLTKNGKMKNYLVHRLVAETFIYNPNNFLEVNHKNEDKSCNYAYNLEWCTHKYNMNYGNRPNKNALKVLQLDLNNNLIATYNSIREAGRKTDINQSHITKCCKGVLKTIGGFVWKYKE